MEDLRNRRETAIWKRKTVSGRKNNGNNCLLLKMAVFIDYYLWVTIGVTTGIVILIFLIVHFATKTSFVMGVMAVNTDGEHIEATGPDYFTDFLREHGVMSKRDVVNLNYTIWIDPNSDSDVDSTNLSTIQVLFMTRSVDVFFLTKSF